MRGAGTSIAGNAVGPGVVVDTSRHLSPGASTSTPRPGRPTSSPASCRPRCRRRPRPHGLRFGPDPSTHNRCTVGGMIGNNACGSRALGYGRTSDNVVGLDVVTGGGARLRLGRRRGPAPVLDDLRALVDGDLATHPHRVRPLRPPGVRLLARAPAARARLRRRPGPGRQRGHAGASSSGATVRLVADAAAPRARRARLPVDGRRRRRDPGPAPALGPTAVEGLDARIVQRLRDVPAAVVPDLPRGEGWLIVELTGDSVAEIEATARAGRRRRRRAGLPGGHRRRARRPRCGGSARTAPGWPPAPATGRPRTPAGRTPPCRPSGWATTCASSRRCWPSTGCSGVPYGHFGDGCVHVRIDFPFGAGQAARPRPRRTASFVEDAARLVAGYGGSLSGEHGDGRARSELLPLMYSPAAIALFERVKALFDPDDVLNPGVLVRPAPVDADVRVAAAPPLPDRAGAGLPARRRRLLRGRAPLHRRRQVPGRPAGHRRRDVPVVAGHPRGEGHHPRPGPGAAGDARARRPGAAAGARPRCTTRSTCACPARAARATARPASTWRPTRPRCCTSPTGAGCGRGRTTRSAGCRAGPTSPRGRRGW